MVDRAAQGQECAMQPLFASCEARTNQLIATFSMIGVTPTIVLRVVIRVCPVRAS